MRKYLIPALLLCATPAFATDLRHVEDASLRSVFFIDPQEGWIVGDEGVILHTIDGGKRWERQPTGTRASLRSVQFLTPFIGWAVGREELPYGQGSAGVILFTSDGGLEWKKQLANTLPGLNQVRFVDSKTGFLCGDGNDQFPFGVFKTTDSGKTWEPVSGPRTTSWLAADFFDGDKGILVGAWSRLAVMRRDETTNVMTLPSVLGGALATPILNRGAGGSPAQNATKSIVKEHADWLAGRDITSVQILGKKTIAVGQGGLVLSSTSDGKAWGFVDTKLPTKVLANLDFHAMHSVKDNVWIAGRPGSVILHSSDGGTTWSLQKTGQPLPLHGVFFFDEKLGFAVGDAGTIVQSTDGGKSWKVQHQGGKRAAATCIHWTNQTTPVDTLTHLGLTEGYLTTSLRVTSPDPATVTWNRNQDERRYATAVRLAGGLVGETLWHFPTPQHLERCDKKAVLAHWNQVHKNSADEELLRQLVLKVRTWRPSALIVDNEPVLMDAIIEVVKRAKDAKAFPEQIDELGLTAWKVEQAMIHSPDSGNVWQDNDKTNARLQMSVRDFAASAQALLFDRATYQFKTRRYLFVEPYVGRESPRISCMDGLDAKAGDARRELKSDAKADTTFAATMTAQRSAISMADNIDNPVQALKLIPPVLDKLPDEQAAFAAFAVAGRYAERGQWYAAQEFYLYLVDRAPSHPLAAESYRWLLAFNTSSEAKRRQELKHFAVGEPIGLTHKKGPPLVEEKVVKAGHIVPAGSEILSRTDVREWNKAGHEWAKRLHSFGTMQQFEPGVHFGWQAARRNLGDVGSSNSAMHRFRKFIPAGPWHDAARAELWLTDRSETPPRVGRVRYTEVRPYLDGKFDDPCWKDLKPMLLDNAVGDTAKQYRTEAMFAFDQEFMYIALKCTHPEGQHAAPLKPRPRDADVDGHDRISILLDIDRDYTTYYHLEVDQRGALRDSCWGDRNWNPKWFVAVQSDETAWQIEAAIPLSELTSERIAQQTAWAFNIVRIMPGRGVQSWTIPADVRPRPEGMSLLLFDHGKARVMPAP